MMILVLNYGHGIAPTIRSARPDGRGRAEQIERLQEIADNLGSHPEAYVYEKRAAEWTMVSVRSNGGKWTTLP